jgi:hypothetical protein
MSKVYATFQQWSEQGWKVKKGQKHVGRLNDGTCLFEKGQCEYVNKRKTFYERSVWEDRIPVWDDADDNLFKSYPGNPPEPQPVYYADGSGYLPGSGPAGPLYFDKFGNT